MRRAIVALLVSVLLAAGFALLPKRQASAQDVAAGDLVVIQEVKHDVSPPLRDIAIPAVPSTGRGRIIPLHRGLPGAPMISTEPDAVAQEVDFAPLVSTTNLLNFDGQNADSVAPPDTNGSVGATQYVQWVNLEYNVYNKTTGAKILGPIQGNSFWSGFGGACQTRNSGDPIILYDKAAGRWLAAQKVFSPPYMDCIAVSTTSDATGTYNRYAFPLGSTNFPDYPKWGVWPDAYYESFNNFKNGITETSAEACAADRKKMLAGNKATLICKLPSNNAVNLLPSDLDGATPPPAGSPNYYLGIQDTSHLQEFQFHVDFVTPSNSTFTGPTSIPVAAFSEICSNGTNRACVPQPSPGEKLDSLGDRLMYRLAYRNFTDHEALVVNHTVKGGPLAGIRWYEIRSPATPTVFQQGTLTNAGINFWLGSIAMDKVGDIALGFSASSSSIDPTIAYTGRVPTDPVNTMEPLKVVIKGTGVQESTSNRWGDYSSMSIDPSDDCTFFFTEEYIKTTGTFNWRTRINSFKFTTCM